jgi:hypothetical protein
MPTHFARCGSYRTGEVPLGSRHKGERLTAPARLLWLSIRIAMMVLDADLHFALDRRSASEIQPQIYGSSNNINNSSPLRSYECSPCSLDHLIYIQDYSNRVAKHHLNVVKMIYQVSLSISNGLNPCTLIESQCY